MMYYDLYQFLKIYEDNLSFRQDNLKDLVSKFVQEKRSDLAKFIEEVIIYGRQQVKPEFLTQKETDFICDILTSLGRADKDTELQQVKHFQFLVNSKLATAKETKEKYSALSIKISFLIGLLLVVLLL